jgi:hypothetical protein
MSASAWTRVSGAMGIPFVIAYLVTIALTGDTPDDQSSDEKILDYYASHSNRVKDITTFFVIVVGLLLLVWFVGHMHRVLRSAEGDDGRAAGIAAVSGGLFIAVLAVAACVFSAVSPVISDAGDKFTLDPNTFRLLNVVGFLAYIAAFMLGSAFAFTIGVVAWQTGVLPRWLAVVSFLGGLGGFLSGLFIPSFVYLAWILVLSVYLAFRPAGEPAPGAPSASVPAAGD